MQNNPNITNRDRSSEDNNTFDEVEQNSKSNLQPSNINSNEEPYRLWITDQFYIPVDSKGLCIGTCFEGALGFVIKVKSKDNRATLALKIPKLTGDTERENVYISDLMEKEVNALRKLFGGEDPVTRGLLNALNVFDSLLRGYIKTSVVNTEAYEWKDAIVFVHYEKGKNPQFALVKKGEDNQVKIFPEESNFPEALFNHFNILPDDNKWSQTIFTDLDEESHKEKIRTFSIKELPKSNNNIWCTSLPSIMYGWAPGTLQEVISLGKRGKWTISQHLGLINNLCQGLFSLHRIGMLHADLRPANVVFQGEPQMPGNYFLSDYGSFAETGSEAAGGQTPGGETIVGPILSGERKSAFYAPERQAGKEREAADTAVIKMGAGDNFYVILGWRSDLINSQTNQVNENQINQYIEKKKNYALPLGLSKGDRIQVRDYIFELAAGEWNIEDKQVLECNQKIWKIYQSRITIETQAPYEFKEEFQWFPIPRTIELLQWSAATDLYSLGALALYSVYSDYEPTLTEQEPNETNSNTANNKLKKSRIEIEEGFYNMLTYLASPPYFKSIWTEIELLRRNLESNLNNRDLAQREFPEIPYNYYDLPSSLTDSNKKEYKTLKEAVIGISRLITQTVPEAGKLVAAMGYDLGRFIFFIHFILCCLHRSSDLGDQKEVWMQEPFAKDRLEPPNKNGAVEKALKRLADLNPIILNNYLDELKVEPKQIPVFNPRPDTTLRFTVENLKAEKRKALDQLENLKWRDPLHFDKNKEQIIKILRG